MPPPPKTGNYNGPVALSDGSVAFYDSNGNYQSSQPPPMSNDTKAMNVLNDTKNTTNPQDIVDSGRTAAEPTNPLPSDFKVLSNGSVEGSYTNKDGVTVPYLYKNMVQAQSGAQVSDYNKAYAPVKKIWDGIN